jgi:hypothetical protein
MCSHDNCQTIEEGLTEERWEEDLYVQDFFDWVVCADCGVDFACKLP